MSDPASDLVVYAARLVRHVRRDLGVPAAYRVLSMVDELGPVGTSQLAQADGTSQPSMSAQIAALVDHGLLDKQPHPGDARATLLTLTEQGRARLAANREHIAEAVRYRLAGQSPERIAIAVAVLRDLSRDLTQEGIQ